MIKLSPALKLTCLYCPIFLIRKKKQFLAALDDSPDIFAEKPGLCKAAVHETNVTPDFKPERLKAYKIPELLKLEVARQVQELHDLGFIRSSNSEMATPTVCVLKGRSAGKRACTYVATTATLIS